MTDDVSRETSARLEAINHAGDRAALLIAYAEVLAHEGIEHGMIGPREVPRLWDRHLLNSIQVIGRIPHGASVADVGTGAGLPGVVWAIARPDLHVTLIEPLLRRTRFLEMVVERLAMTNVTIIRARADEVDERFDVVTSRAVAALDKLAKWCVPLIAPGGSMVALKGRSAAQEVDSARAWLARHGVRDIVVASYGTGESATTVVDFTVPRET